MMSWRYRIVVVGLVGLIGAVAAWLPVAAAAVPRAAVPYGAVPYGAVPYGAVSRLAPAAVPGYPAGDWTPTEWGPLGKADRDLLMAVHRVALWQVPAARSAGDKATSDRVRRAGATIGTEQREMDAKVRSVASRLGVLLSDRSAAEQQTWLSELDTAAGAAFDRLFVDRMRAADGTALALLAPVRAGTRNSLVRGFADEASERILAQMTLLESTGLVDYAALPSPATGWTASSAAEASRAAAQLAKARDVLHRGDRRVAGGPLIQPKSFDIGTFSRPLVWLMVLAGFAAVAAAAMKALRAR